LRWNELQRLDSGSKARTFYFDDSEDDLMTA
jgi:hypothetical protein